jgi:WD40 repeat protein
MMYTSPQPVADLPGDRPLADAFISYSRIDLAFALRLEAALIAAGQTVWLDKNDIPAAAPWLPEVQSGIDSADNFLFILSPDSVASGPCMEELAHAITNGKRLVPICYRKPDQSTVPTALAPINYIFFDESVDFDAALKTLIAAMHTDLAWVRSHTRLQVRALEWQAKNGDKSYLLGGSDLKDAESWLARAASQPIKPTDLQSQYILASRTAATRAQRRNLTIAIGVAVVASALAVVAVIQYFAAKRETVVADKATKTAVEQRQEADRQRAEAERQRDAAEHETKIATSGRLAATAISLKDTQFDLGSLLSLEAARLEPTFDTLNAQVTLFESSPDLITYLRQPGAQTSFIDSIAFTRDGKRFATSTDEGVITLWDARTRRPVATLPKPPKPSDAFQIAFSPDGSTLAVAYYYDAGGVQLWNVAGPHPARIQPVATLQPDSLCCVAFHPTGKLVATGGVGGVQIWTLPQLQPIRTQPKQSIDAPVVQGLAFSPKDPLLLAYTVGGVIRLENAVTGQSRGEIRLPTPPGASIDAATFGQIAFSPDGSLIVAGPRSGGTLGVWKLEARGDSYTGSLRDTLTLGDNGIPMGIAFRPDGKELVAISNHGAMRKWDTGSLKLLRDYSPTLAVDIRSLAFTRDGGQIFAGLNSGIMLLWSDSDLTLRPVDKSQYPSNPAAAFNLDSPSATSQPWIIAPASPNTAARITPGGVEVRTHGRTSTLPGSPQSATHLAISSDGHFVAASSDQSRALWDISQPAPRSIPFAGKDNITFALAFSPSGNRLATAEYTGLYLWDAGTGKLIGENVEPNRTAAVNLAFSPDGSRIALVLNGGEVLLIDAATQRLLGTHVFAGTENFGSDPSAVAFSKDGRSLFIRNGSDHTVFQWDADPKSWAARACRVANRNLSLDEWKRYIGDTIPYHRTCPQFPDGEGVHP